MLQDLDNACRALLKTPWFTCVTVLTLALGLGANTAIFGVVNKLLLDPLPYPDADSIVFLRVGDARVAFGYPLPGFFVDQLRAEAQSLDGVEAYEFRDVLAYDDSGARVVRGMRITPGLPTLLGVRPLLGRAFTAEDAVVGAPDVVVLSYEVWQRDYGGARDVLGRTITLDEAPHVVVGVMPARWDAFASPTIRFDVWFPLAIQPASSFATGFQGVSAVARLRPGVSFEAVGGELNLLLRRALEEVSRQIFNTEVTVRVQRPAERVGANVRDALLLLIGAVALVLLVACSNVANLLLARGASRARELALRAALGASNWRLVRALLAECAVLALLGGLAGVAFGWLTLRVIARLRPNALMSLGEIDGTVVACTFGVSIVTALLFGAAPALQLGSRKLGDALRHGASGVMRGGSGARARKLLVAAQMALSVVLLVSAGLLVRSFVNLQNVDVGFDTDNLFTAQLSLPRGRYEAAASRDALSDELLERIGSLPSVAAVTQAFMAPPNTMTMSGLTLEIRGGTLSETDARASFGSNFVRPNYFETLGIRLREGRTFTNEEVRSGAAVVINRAAAQRFWPAGNAVGAEVKRAESWATVVGVVEDVVAGGLTQPPEGPRFYVPFLSERTPLAAGPPPTLVLIVRAVGDPAHAIAAVRAEAAALDAEIATNVVMVETALANTIEAPRFNMALLTLFAVIGLLLAAVGLAAVIGYEVTERTHEIGIRMALGARSENVRRLAMRHGLTPAFAGVVIGVVGALAATGLAQRVLYGVTPRDPPTFVGVITLLVIVALVAAWLPARRATRVDPIIALRAD